MIKLIDICEILLDKKDNDGWMCFGFCEKLLES